MNHVYKVVFNRALGVYQCVSEIAKSQGKSSGKSATSGTKSVFNLTTLSVAMFGVMGLGTASLAQATDYNSGSTTITDNPYIVVNDTISGPETEVTFNDVLIGNTEDGSLKINSIKPWVQNLDIKTGAAVKANDVQLGVNDNVNGSLLINTHGSKSAVSTQDMIVGINGTGHLTHQGVSTLSVSNLVIGQNAQSKKNTVELNGKNYNEGVIKASNDIIIGDAGSGVVTFKKGHMVADNQIYIGKQGGSNGLVNIYDSFSFYGLRAGSSIHVGYEGTGNLNIFQSGASADNIIIGSQSSGVGAITIDGNKGENFSELNANNLIIGDSGQGKLIIQSHQDEEGWFGTGIDTTNAIIGNKAGSKGELYVEDSVIEIENELVVGNQGTGSIIADNTIIELADIKRNPNSQGSKVEFDGVSLWVTKANSNLFSGFDSSTPIILKSNGMVIANDNDYTSKNGDVYNYDIKINPNAVFKGNVGDLNLSLLEEDLLGGFIKAGGGLIEISDKSMQWQGDTAVLQGTLKINGDFSLNDGEQLGIGILETDDWVNSDDDDEHIENKPTTLAGVDSGKLEVTGTADISKGSLFVYAEEAIKGTAKDTVWKNAVTAGNLVGKFKEVEDNSPFVKFYADYSDPNKVHITLKDPTAEDGGDTGNEAGVETGNETGGNTESNDISFVEALGFVNNRADLGLAATLDESIADIKAGNNNELAKALVSDILISDSEEDDVRKAKVAISAEQLQPLFMGGANRLITDSNYATTNAISEHSQTSSDRRLWAKAIGSDMTRDADDYVTGYNSENYGAIVGLDLPVNPGLNLGVAVSYIESDADTDGHALNHELDAKNWQILGYANYAASEATSINFHAGAGQSSVDGERHIQLPSSLTAKSDYDVDTMQAGFGVSHQLGSDTRNVAPFASFNYARAESDGYSEKGAGAYNLTVDENTYESMRWTAGLRFNKAVTPTVSVTGQLAGAIENGDSYSDITASFTNVDSNKFYTQGQESEEAIGIAGIGLAFKPTANTTISANYRGEWRDNYDDQGAAIVFETKF